MRITRRQGGRGAWGQGSAEGWVRVFYAGAVGVLLTLGAAFLAWRAQEAAAEAQFQRRVSLYLAAFQERRNGVEDVLLTLRALFNQKSDLERRFFHETVADLAIRVDVVQALVWAPRVRDGERAALEAGLQAEGFEGFEIREGDLIHTEDGGPVRSPVRPEYFPAVFLEPYAGNEAALGYDLAAVETIRRTIEKARDSGLISVSGLVNLRYTNAILPAFMVVAPVYGPALRPPTLEERREQFQGVVVAAFIIPQTLRVLDGRLPGNQLEVMLVDVTPGEPRQLLHLPGQVTPRLPDVAVVEPQFRRSPHHEAVFDIGDRRWMLLFRRAPGWSSGLGRWQPWTLLVSGLVFTGALVLHLEGSRRRTLEIEATVHRRTAELAAANVRLETEVRDRVQVQADLARERNLLRTLLDRLPDSVFVTDVECRYLMLNEVHRRLLGIGREAEALHRPVREVGLPTLAQALASELEEPLKSGRPVLHQEQSVRLGADLEKWLLTSKLPLRNPRGEVDGLVVLCRDITEEKREAHYRAGLTQRLQEAQKLESLGLLAGGIAHDFNNLLTSVLGNVGLARLDLATSSPALGCLDQIERTAIRAADLCKQMLAYSGKGRFIVRRIDLSALVEETTDLLRLSISKKAVLNLQLTPGLPAVSADATQLHQILMNLVMNASDAIGDRSGVIRIETGFMRVDQAFLAGTAFAADLEPGDYVFLEVRDNGSGMSPETQARIFDPFFTTKFLGRGLGLAAVLGIVRGHKGAIKVWSEVGRGTSFRLLLPPVEGPADAESRPDGAGVSWRGSGRLLVVDDEETVRAVTSRILERAGFEVDTAADGRQAVAAFRADPDRYRAIVLDLTMPHMDGAETFGELRRIRRDVRVLLMSGFSLQEAVDRFAGKGLGGFIQKPFGGQALIEALKALLTPKPG